jgi:hypothetical protein
MAALAGGRLNGVAPNADLFLVKTKGQWRNNSGRQMNSHHTYDSIRTFLAKVEDHINSRRDENPQPKFVINWSGGKTGLQQA